MSMTWGEFRRWVAEMDALRAESMLDAAQAASVPHYTDEGRRGWYDQMIARSLGDGGRAQDEAPSVATGFTFNGTPMSFDSLRDALGSALGGGVSQ